MHKISDNFHDFLLQIKRKMERKMKKKSIQHSRFTVQNMVDGFLLDCSARRLSIHTISDYRNTMKKFRAFVGSDKPIDEITRYDLRAFFASQTVSNKTVRNYFMALSVFFKFAVAENVIDENPLIGIKLPKPETREIEPITEADIRKLLKTIDSHNSIHKIRNRAIVYLLLDTGLRVSELCGIERDTLDLENRTVKVFGKNSKERIVAFSQTTAKHLWKHLSTCNNDNNDKNESKYLFTANNGNPLYRDNVCAMLYYWCDKAGIKRFSPHKLRHTYAISFLRNGGNIYALQYSLGHTDLGMTKRYLAISNVDIVDAHKLASPVRNLGL